jgi:hypothetical protein
MKKLLLIIILIFTACVCQGQSKILNIENLFKRNKDVFSVSSHEDIAKKKAEKAKSQALEAQKDALENQITIIEVNIDWSYITFYYVGLIFVAGIYIYTDYKKETK